MTKKKAVKEDQDETTVKIHFPNHKSADLFLTWLCDQGEQDYWEAMSYQDGEDNLVVAFDFWIDNTNFHETLEIKAEIYEEFFKGEEE